MIEFFKSLSFKKLLSNRRFTIPFSIFLAFTFWLFLTVNEKPNEELSIPDVSVSVSLENTFAAENGLSIVGDISDQKFTVAVQGPRYVVSGLNSSDLKLYVSAAEVDAPGEYKLTVMAPATTGRSYDILKITPSTLTVNFDYIEKKDFTIEATALGATATEGLIAENAIVSGIEGNKITIEGPRTIVNKIEKVVAEAKVNKTLSQSATFDADIVLYDAEAQVLSQENLSMSITKPKVTVQISKKKTVPVVLSFSNLPVGFDKATLPYSIDHSEVTIIGTPEEVDKTNQVTLAPIDMSTLSVSTGEIKVAPKLTEGVRLLDSIEDFTVSFNFGSYIEKTVTISQVVYKDLSGSLSVESVLPIKNVKICGPRNIINRVNASKIIAEISLADKKAGEHTVNATFKLDGYTNIWVNGTYRTTVTIK